MRLGHLLVVAPLLVACRHDARDVLPPMVVCDTTAVTWSGTVVPILQTRCALSTCHVTGGNGTGNFTTYAGVQTQVANGKLLNAVQHLPGALPMPPNAPAIPACEIQALVTWVNDGALEN
ncbi:MAG: cytochrome c [Flavobacteriales bacterium]